MCLCGVNFYVVNCVCVCFCMQVSKKMYIRCQKHRNLVCATPSSRTNVQGDHKPGVLGDFYEHGKLREFLGNSVQQNSFSSLSSSNICVTQHGLELQMNKVS